MTGGSMSVPSWRSCGSWGGMREEEDEADETRYEERLPNSKRPQLDPEVVGLGLGLQLPSGSHDGDVQMDM